MKNKKRMTGNLRFLTRARIEFGSGTSTWGCEHSWL